MSARYQKPETRPKPGCDILLAVDAYMPWSGGSRIYYDNLYRRLADEHRMSVSVETSHCAGDDTFDQKFASSRLTIRRSGSRLPDWKLHRAPSLARKMLLIAHAVRECAPGAIHCGDLFPQDFAGMLIRKLRGTPLLVFVHGDEVNQTQRRRFQPRLRDAIYRAADAIVVANRFAYERLIDVLRSPDRITMITPGVDTTLFYPGPRPEWVRSQFRTANDPLILTVGRLVRKKGHETVLRSLPAVLKRFSQTKYLVVGDGPERERLQNLAIDLGLGGCVHFAGNVPNYRIADYYRAADIFCLLNQEDDAGDIESFGMVFVEAGASGKPVVGGRSGGTAQSILDGRTGMLCEPGNSSQLSDLLLLLLSSRELRMQMGESGLARARDEFNWSSRATQLLEVHRFITGEEQRKPGGTGLCFRR